jgi:predicted ABC-type ATPase
VSESKRLRIFAGPNGSGKSELFKKFKEKYPTGFFVNADEIEKKLATTGLIDLSQAVSTVAPADFTDFKNTKSAESLFQKVKKDGRSINLELTENFLVNKNKQTHSYEAAFAAAFIRYLLLKHGKSFSVETVMSHPSKLDEIREANKRGYKTYLYFICTENPQINISRVENRVNKGGHRVSEEKLVNRYQRSLQNLVEAYNITLRSYFFDNSKRTTELIAEGYMGKQIKTYKNDLPNWFEDILVRILTE